MSDWNQTYPICASKSDVIWTCASAAAVSTDRLRNPWHCASHVREGRTKVATIHSRALMPLLFRSDLHEPCGIRGDNTRSLTSTFFRSITSSSLHLILHLRRIHTGPGFPPKQIPRHTKWSSAHHEARHRKGEIQFWLCFRPHPSTGKFVLQACSLMNAIYSFCLVGLSTSPCVGSQITSAHIFEFVCSVRQV